MAVRRFELARGRSWRRSRHPRRSERAVSDHGRLHQTHGSRPSRYRKRLSQAWTETAGRRASGVAVTRSPDAIHWGIKLDVSTLLDMIRTGDFFQQTSKVLTVTELTRSIRGTLETKFRAVWVQGEISNYKLHPSGHQYFTLKDQRTQISCVIWRDTMAPPRQPLADGSRCRFTARSQFLKHADNIS